MQRIDPKQIIAEAEKAFQALGLRYNPQALLTPDDIDSHFRARFRKFHPDKVKGTAEDEEKAAHAYAAADTARQFLTKNYIKIKTAIIQLQNISMSSASAAGNRTLDSGAFARFNEARVNVAKGATKVPAAMDEKSQSLPAMGARSQSDNVLSSSSSLSQEKDTKPRRASSPVASAVAVSHKHKKRQKASGQEGSRVTSVNLLAWLEQFKQNYYKLPNDSVYATDFVKRTEQQTHKAEEFFQAILLNIAQKGQHSRIARAFKMTMEDKKLKLNESDFSSAMTCPSPARR